MGIKVASNLHDLKPPDKKQRMEAPPPRGHNKECRQVIICLGFNHGVLKTGPLEINQKAQSVLFDKSLVADAWLVSSGAVILASRLQRQPF